MNIYLVSQSVETGYDTYDSFVVVAKNEQIARETDPSSYYVWKEDSWNFVFSDGTTERSRNSSWCNPEHVQVALIGKASKGYKETTVICASFNAG